MTNVVESSVCLSRVDMSSVCLSRVGLQRFGFENPL